MNNVNLMGRLTADPELRTTQSGLTVTRFAIAVKRKYSKEGQQDTDFINCIAWRHTAEFISKYFHKGNMIALSGSIQTGSYEKDGKKVYITNILVDDVYFTGEKNTANAQQNQQINSGFDNFMPTAQIDDLPF